MILPEKKQMVPKPQEEIAQKRKLSPKEKNKTKTNTPEEANSYGPEVNSAYSK